jgi:nuclear receptor co-repressor 1
LTFDVVSNFDEKTSSKEISWELDPTDWTDKEKSIFIRAMPSQGFCNDLRVVESRTRDQCRVFFSLARMDWI